MKKLLLLVLLFPLFLFSFSEPVPSCPINWDGPSYSQFSPGPSLSDTSCNSGNHSDGISINKDEPRYKSWHISNFEINCTQNDGYAGKVYNSYNLSCRCNIDDENFPIDSSQYKIAKTVIPIDCNTNPIDVGDANSACSALGGFFYETSIINCCSTSACLISLDTNETNQTGCPEGEKLDTDGETCICNNGFPKVTNENGVLICQNPKCPPYYDANIPPLPLFKSTDDPSKCNFFKMSDSAYLQIENLVCCYGQEDDLNNTKCGLNQIEINGVCYDIKSNSSPDKNTSCPLGQYYSFEANKCVSFYPDNDNNVTIMLPINRTT